MRRIDAGDTGTISEEVSSNLNLNSRYGTQVQSPKKVFILSMNDRIPLVFGILTARNGNITISSELYMVQDEGKKIASLHGNMRIEIEKSKNEYITLTFGKRGKLQDGTQLYMKEKDIVVDKNNNPTKGILTVEVQSLKSVSGDRETTKNSKTYNFANLNNDERERILKN